MTKNILISIVLLIVLSGCSLLQLPTTEEVSTDPDISFESRTAQVINDKADRYFVNADTPEQRVLRVRAILTTIAGVGLYKLENETMNKNHDRRIFSVVSVVAIKGKNQRFILF